MDEVCIIEDPHMKKIRLNRGYKDIVEVDAKKLVERFEKDNNEKIAWSSERLESARQRIKECYDSYPQLWVNSDGTIDINDGRHRIAASAEADKRIKIAVRDKDDSIWGELNG